MKIAVHRRDIFSLRLAALEGWRIAIVALTFAFFGILIGGCVFRPSVLTIPGNQVDVQKIFPSALLAEPIQLRAGYVHTTQKFKIKNPAERWGVAMGFVRSDTGMPAGKRINETYDVCWVEIVGKGFGYSRCTKELLAGYSLKWELLREDESVAAHFTFDSALEDSGGTYAANAITRNLSGFSNQREGLHRLRITVLRDTRELDFLKPHILVDRPFFSSRSIE